MQTNLDWETILLHNIDYKCVFKAYVFHLFWNTSSLLFYFKTMDVVIQLGELRLTVLGADFMSSMC